MIKQVLILVGLVRFANAGFLRIGESCTLDSECMSVYTGAHEVCRYGICQCNNRIINSTEIRFDEYGNPVCDYSISVKRGCHGCQNDETKECINSSCVCKQNLYQLSNERCVHGQRAYVANVCGGTSMNFCDRKLKTFCKSGLINNYCVCFRDFFFNATSSACEPKSNYRKKYGLTEYKAKIGDYCLEDRDCLNGLECLFVSRDYWNLSMSCKCPKGCLYMNEGMECDCGAVSFGFENIPIIGGVCLCILSILWWSCCIGITLKRKRSGKNEGHVSYTAPSEDGSASVPIASNTATADCLEDKSEISGQNFDKINAMDIPAIDQNQYPTNPAISASSLVPSNRDACQFTPNSHLFDAPSISTHSEVVSDKIQDAIKQPEMVVDKPLEPTKFKPYSPFDTTHSESILDNPSPPYQYKPMEPYKYQPSEVYENKPLEPYKYEPSAPSASYQPVPMVDKPLEPYRYKPSVPCQNTPVESIGYKSAEEFVFKPLEDKYKPMLYGATIAENL